MKMKIVCYPLQEYFNTQPQHISACPQCKTLLTQESTNPTERGVWFNEHSLISYVETVKSHCHTCHWWALREICREHGASSTCKPDDELITLLPEIDKHLEPIEIETDVSQPPWDKLYKSGDYLKKNIITSEIVEWLWGIPLK